MTHHLIIQGEDVSTPDLKKLHALSEARGIERVGDMAFRLLQANPGRQPEVAGHCSTARLDWAFVPAGRRWRDLRLIAMDMDSTLITIECLDEIADFAGVKPEVAAITEAAMRGEISDWQESFRRRVALLAGLDSRAMTQVYEERLRLTPGAEALLSEAKAAGIHLLLVSGGFDDIAGRLRDRLGLDAAYSNSVEIVDGKFTGRVLGRLVDGQEKARLVRQTLAERGLSPDQAMAIGDGANDLPMMREVGIGIAFHAKPVVRAQATHALSHVGLDGVLNLFER